MPVSRIADFIAEASEAVVKFYPGARLVIFGHVGDGNIHFDVIQPEGGDGAALRPGATTALASCTTSSPATTARSPPNTASAG